MPIYAYRCSNCGFAEDVLQKLSAEPLHICPQCGQDTFRKQVTAAGFQLKGSGWYVTDFRDGNKKPADKAAPATADAPSAADKPAAAPAPATDAKSTPASETKPSAPAPAPAPTSSGGGTSGVSSPLSSRLG